MNYLLTVATGMLVSIMIALNGGLSNQYGVYASTVIIHIVGLVAISLIVIMKKERPFAKRTDWLFYMGGVIGVATTSFNNIAFGRISVSAILALALLAQSVLGLFFDHYGWLGMPRHAFRKKKIVGLALLLLGIVVMLESGDVVAVVVSLLSGVSLIVARILNARLAEETSAYVSTFLNYLIGLCVAVAACLAFGRGEPMLTQFVFSANVPMYMGGLLGVLVVMLSNITVTKVSALYLSMLLFVGQVSTSLVLDSLLSGAFSPRLLAGNLLVAAGFLVNLYMDHKQKNA